MLEGLLCFFSPFWGFEDVCNFQIDWAKNDCSGKADNFFVPLLVCAFVQAAGQSEGDFGYPTILFKVLGRGSILSEDLSCLVLMVIYFSKNSFQVVYSSSINTPAHAQHSTYVPYVQYHQRQLLPHYAKNGYEQCQP